jgi:hypothetical protein
MIFENLRIADVATQRADRVRRCPGRLPQALLNMPVASHFPELRPADLHGRVAACRSLATTSNNADRKALWLDRAAYWEELAFEASARLVDAARTQRIK